MHITCMIFIRVVFHFTSIYFTVGMKNTDIYIEIAHVRECLITKSVKVTMIPHHFALQHTHTPYQKSFAIKTTVTISLNLFLL